MEENFITQKRIEERLKEAESRRDAYGHDKDDNFYNAISGVIGAYKEILLEISKQEKPNSDESYVVFEEHQNEGLTQLSNPLPNLEKAKWYANSWKEKTLYIYKFIEQTPTE